MPRGLSALALLVGGAAAGAQTITVRGSVLDSATQQTMTGAIVSLRSGARLISVRADETGAFVISGVSAGNSTLSARRLGYLQVEWAVNLVHDTTVTLVLRPTARVLAPVRVGASGEGIWGVIGRADDLQPIAGAKVFVVGSATSVETDAAGQYFVPLKRPGRYMVRVTSNGYAEEILPVIVKENQVVESSELLEGSSRKPLPIGAWMDFDYRLRWASPTQSVLVTGAEVRAAGATIRDALASTPEFVLKGLRWAPRSACVFLNGAPKPGMTVDAINVEDIRAIEVYGKEKTLANLWPRNGMCGDGTPPVTRPSNRKEPPMATWVVIWTR